MFAQISAALAGAPAENACASADTGADRIVDLLQAIGRYTSAAQITDFIRMLYSKLHQDAGGQLDDKETQILHQIAKRRAEELKDAREKRLPPTRSWFPVRAKSEQSREEAASGRRDPARWARKRRLGGLASLPPTKEYEVFTEGERAALYIIAADMREIGSCGCTVAEIADRAGVGATTVRNAVRKAKSHGMIRVTHRPQWRNKWLANVITIVCETWLGWLKRFRPNLGFNFKGVKKPASTDTYGKIIKMERPSHQSNGGSTTRFQRFASRKPPSD